MFDAYIQVKESLKSILLAMELTREKEMVCFMVFYS